MNTYEHLNKLTALTNSIFVKFLLKNELRLSERKINPVDPHRIINVINILQSEEETHGDKKGRRTI